MTYTDITSDGGMDPRNVAHHRVMVEAANTEANRVSVELAGGEPT